jgi:hypothetical protein
MTLATVWKRQLVNAMEEEEMKRVSHVLGLIEQM